MKVKIVKCCDNLYWYKEKIGKIFEVKKSGNNYVCLDEVSLIDKEDCKIVEDDTRENTHQYFELERILKLALEQASGGKGKERHSSGEDFEKQKICEISRRLGSNDYNLGQAVKKIYESKRLPKERAIAELLGAINYIAAGIIILEESEK